MGSRAGYFSRRLVVAVAVVGGVGAVTPWDPASAAIVEVDGCVVDGAVVSVEVDDETLAPYEGSWYALHTGGGTIVDHSQPVGTLTEVPPVCVVPITDGQPDSSRATWAWCTEVWDHVCAEGPLSGRSTIGVLDENEAALVAWRVNEWMESGVTTTASLHETQFNIWCITDDFTFPATFTWGSAPATVTTCAEYQAWLTAEILPSLVTSDDTLELHGPAAAVTVGTTQVFTVTSTLGSVQVVAAGADTFGLCDGVAGATFTGTTLTIDTPGTAVDLCATRSVAGDVTVEVSTSSTHFAPANIIGFEQDDCQVLFTDTIHSSLLDGAASATFLAAAVVTTVPTTTAPTTTGPATTAEPTTSTAVSTTEPSTGTAAPSTTTSGGLVPIAPTSTAGSAPVVTLPVTGSGSAPVAFAAGLLLVAGAGTMVVSRRRSA